MLVLAVVVSEVFLGGMMEGEKVSRRQVEVAVQIYCYELVTRGLTLELLSLIVAVRWRDLASTYVLHPS